MQNRQRAGRDGVGGVGGRGGGEEKREGEGASNYSLRNIGCLWAQWLIMHCSHPAESA